MLRDPDGIVHVFADNPRDLFLLQGYATARDRFFQMDLLRRRAYGRRAEVLGESFYASDLQSRALGFGVLGEQTAVALVEDDPEILGFMEAYAQGVNAWRERALAGTDGASLSPQFAALGYEPEAWTATDSLAIEKLLTAGLSMRPDQDITLGLLELLVGADFFDDLYLYAAFDREYVVPDFYDGMSAAVPAPSPAAPLRVPDLNQAELAQALRAARELDMSGGGSNNWAISGDHTASGAAIIAGDSHQGVEHPAVYYFIHLNTAEAGGDIDAVGATFPGVPFVLFGHNGTVGFTPTTSIYDVADAYLEQFNGNSVEFDGASVPVEKRSEDILVRAAGGSVADAEARSVELVTVPHHGPLLPAEALGLPLPLNITIRWTGTQARTAARTFYELDRARSFDDFRAALEFYVAGGMHWVYADTAGNIGYSSRVDIPVRERVDGATPPTQLLPGEGGYEWLADPSGERPYQRLSSDDIPFILNPASGYIGTGNNDPVGQTDDGDPFDAPVYLSGIFDIGTRALRPRQLFDELSAAGPLSIDDAAAMQLDTWSRLGERLRPFVIEAAERRPDLVTERMAAAIAELDKWDLRCDIDSSGAVVFHGWLVSFARLILSDENAGVSGVLFGDTDARIGLVLTKFVTHWLEVTRADIDDIDSGAKAFPSASGRNFFDDRSTDGVETRDEAILTALASALDELEGIFAALQGGAASDDPANWRWGDWHVMQLVDRADAVLPTASSEALPKSGCLYTVDVADSDWLSDGALPAQLETDNAASNRFVFEMLPEGVRGRVILPGGQSEDPASPHHNDQFEDFVDGRLRDLRYTRPEIEADATETLSFDPGPVP